jgi:hypothetical protein
MLRSAAIRFAPYELAVHPNETTGSSARLAAPLLALTGADVVAVPADTRFRAIGARRCLRQM